MTSDFVEYGAKEAWIHKIYEGQEKINHKPITITTWQSIYKQPKGWFEKFEVVIGDEAHGFKSKSLTGIMSKLTKCEYKFGFTGTLDGTQTHKLVLEGLFGPERIVTTTSELIEQKHLAEFRIKAIVLNHTAEDRDKAKKYTYPEEIDFIMGSEKRNKFLMNLVLSLKGNTLLLFKNIDHGMTLQSYISSKAKDRKVFYVDGDVKGDIRNDYRAQIETETDAIIVASLGTFSTGINIRNLHNVVFASPSKSRVKVLQSIGRGLRKSSIKTSAVLYDVADDLSYKSHRNFTLQHFGERIRMYNEEKFEYKIYNVQI
jgi:superfamily II DNA or RNA helicase